MTIKEYASICKGFGLDAFDLGIILLKNHTPNYIKQVCKDINEVGIPLAMVTTYPDFTHPDKMQRRREFDFLVHDIALASAVGARFLRITAGQAHPETSEEDGIAWTLENFNRAATISDEYGITLVFEDHSKPGAWDYMDFANPPHIFLKIARQLGDTSIMINFDTANILVAGHDTTLEVLDEVIDRVVTIHVADTGTKGKMDPVPIGTGLVPFDDIFRYLKERNFSGWLCLEEWGNKGISGMGEAIDFVRSRWENA